MICERSLHTKLKIRGQQKNKGDGKGWMESMVCDKYQVHMRGINDPLGGNAW